MILPSRFLAGVLGAGLLVAGAGCGSASPSAASVRFATRAVTTGDTTPASYGGAVTIDRSEFEKELKALAANKPLQDASGGSGLFGSGKKTVDPRLAAGWLTAVIYDKLITHEFDRRHLKVTPGDTEAGKAQLANQ